MVDMTIELDREEDGRWLTEIPELPGVMAYGSSQDEVLAKVKALALRVMADRLEHGEAIPDLVDVRKPCFHFERPRPGPSEHDR